MILHKWPSFEKGAKMKAPDRIWLDLHISHNSTEREEEFHQDEYIRKQKVVEMIENEKKHLQSIIGNSNEGIAQIRLCIMFLELLAKLGESDKNKEVENDRIRTRVNR